MSQPSSSEQRAAARPTVAARRWRIGGRVQAVGFRPFVHRLASRLQLKGWVRNQMGEVEVLAQGQERALDIFARDLIASAPPLARPTILATQSVTPTDSLGAFEIRASEAGGAPAIHLPPDYFACADCLRELCDPADRRHGYPFINCTQCGPRYTLITRLPYDRPNTTMAGFALCEACRREYEDPLDRRFHAEPVACPTCGPRLSFRAGARTTHETAQALAQCVAALRAGKIVAVKGIGGYHLMCDARDEAAVARLRARKPRPDKPLAVMFPWRGADGADALREVVAPSPTELAQLIDPVRPIVLVRRHHEGRLARGIAPGLEEIGCFLPYSPLHHLLLNAFDAPLVATSGNVSGEPVLTNNAEAERRLAHVADAFLHHDRPIERPADDAVYRVVAGAARPLRLGRGIAPLELGLPFTLDGPLLATGGHLKNAIALAWRNRVVVSPHIGDLGSARSLAVFECVAQDLQALYGVRAERIVCDAHPGYTSTRWAKRQGLPIVSVHHHRAHASALAGEHPDVPRWLTFTWDGVGYGEDGTLWGGEALLGRPGSWRRVASLRPFRLPGGEKAGREPWRSALAVCWESDQEWAGVPAGAGLLRAAWERRVNAPQTSAVGRLFDAAAALTGVNTHSSYEGQGPMMLEAAACIAEGEATALPIVKDNGLWLSDWAPLIPLLLDTRRSIGERAADFHATFARLILDQARAVREVEGEFSVGLNGGVFQNRRLTEQALALLRKDGFDVRLARALPANDGGLCFGQVIDAAALARR